MSDSTFVLYHANCPDGFCAAWVASGVLGRGPEIVYVPVQYGQPYPPEIDGGVGRLFILDFSYPRATMERLRGCVEGEFLTLDHHRTAEAELAGLPYARFDMEKSGAMLAWEHFRPGQPAPYLVQLVQDRDLWRWSLPGSRAYSAAIASYPKTFEVWDWLAEALDEKPGDDNRGGMFALLREGEAILRHQDILVRSVASKAAMTDVGGHSVPAVNCPLFQSELGERLCLDYPGAPFSGVWSVEGSTGDEIWSLRSRGGFDVSAVARQLGGGGHAAAAGFRKGRAR
jgi:oligoribonuclease NrnB/cAMP/cGMP phosphodiesterase (DHH superfamily)